MIIPNTRHIELPPKAVKLGLPLLTVCLAAVLIGLKFFQPAELGTQASPTPLALHELEETLLLSNPNDFSANLARWQQGSNITDLAGVVVETAKGELIAGSGAFLGADGRLYHDETTESLGLGFTLKEVDKRSIELTTLSGRQIHGRLRVFKFTKHAE